MLPPISHSLFSLSAVGMVFPLPRAKEVILSEAKPPVVFALDDLRLKGSAVPRPPRECQI